MKRVTVAVGSTLAIGAIAGTIVACTSSTPAVHQEQKEQNAISQQMVNAQPLPQFNYSQKRANLTEIETAEAQGAQSTTFFFNMGVRDPIQSCPSIGAPIPTTTQLSNPQQLARTGGNNSIDGVIGNMDPTGVYTGDSSGTYVLCIGGNGQPYANYWEGFVQTVFAPAVWDDATHQLKVTGPASFKFTAHK